MIIKAASFHSHNGLSIVQIVSSPVDTMEYIGLAEALQRNAFEVKELGRASRSGRRGRQLRRSHDS